VAEVGAVEALAPRRGVVVAGVALRLPRAAAAEEEVVAVAVVDDKTTEHSWQW